ncbi:hypothetical protein AZE42_05721 [Rhizopogon vesiculosus]|uniref:Uncharacterized protein n=1 Tax=Rhizopogon vesiculosus TaxID=180088 RepID=A0A1J8R977_9AGAM|nr:hypothetical protein AZE42_05721 [Rhizopogon vesiculosus]
MDLIFFDTSSNEDTLDMGEVGALNRILTFDSGRAIMDPSFSKNGHRSRGSGRCAAVKSRVARGSSEVTLLEKWLDVLIAAAAHTYTSAKVSFPQLDNSTDNSGGCKEKATKTKSKKPAKLNSKILANHDDVSDVDLPEPKDNQKGGANTHPLLLEGLRRCYLLDKGQEKSSSPTENYPPEQSKSFVVSQVSKGCNTTWVMPRNKERILEHLFKCGWIGSALRKGACCELGKNAIGPPAHISLVDEDSESLSHVDSADEDDKKSKPGPHAATKKFYP